MKYCSKCLAGIESGAKACPVCGEKVGGFKKSFLIYIAAPLLAVLILRFAGRLF